MDPHTDETQTGDGLLAVIRIHLPAYPGYGNAGDRRLSDTLLREHCFEELLQFRKRIILSENSLPGSDADEKLQNIRLLENDIGSLIHRLKFASYGNTHFFQDLPAGESEVRSIMELDLSILKHLLALGEAVLDESRATLRMDVLLESVRRILFVIQEIHEFLDIRARLILGRRRPESY